MNFDEEAIGADGDRGAGKRQNFVALAGAVAGIDKNREMAAFFYGRNDGEIERVAGKIGEGSNAADMPRLRRTGFLARPARLRSEKFCMLRAPIWMTSAYSSTRSRDSLSIASVTMPKPWVARTFERILSPSSPRPWKL